MKKVMMVVGVAAVATFVGCKHDEYGAHKVGNKVQSVETVEVASDVDAVDVGTGEVAETTPTAVAPTTDTGDASVPGTMAVKPDDDGGATTTVSTIPDTPVVDVPANDAGAKGATTKVVAAKDDAGKADVGAKDAGSGADKPAAAEPEFTPYVVRGGDTLGGICLRYKVKKADVLKLNPGMNPDKIFVGRTIKLPGNIEAAKASSAPKTAAKPAVKADASAAGAAKTAAAAKREYKPYAGETKEYVVKAGDTMGGIAYSNGLSIRQFKELNGFKSDFLREGQKVKIPAEKVKSDKPLAVASDPKAEKAQGPTVIPDKVEQIKPLDGAVVPTADDPAPAEADKKKDDAAAPKVDAPKLEEDAKGVVEPPPAPAVPDGKYTVYVVKENDDLYSVAIKWSTTASLLKEINGLTDDALTPGQELKGPAVAE